MRNMQSFVENIARNRAKNRRSLMLTTTLAVLVMFGVSFLLTKPADSMTGQLICEKEVHIHSDECMQLVCTLAEHVCDESCQTECTIEHICDENCVQPTECTIEHVCDENCVQPTECTIEHVCDESCQTECTIEHICDVNCVQPTECTIEHICDENCVQPTECTIEHVCDESCQTECGLAHEHSAECYELVCTKEEHEHSQNCYQIAENSFLTTYYDSGIQIMEDEQAAAEENEQTIIENEWFETSEISLPSGIDVSDNLYSKGDNITGALENSGTYEDDKPVKFQISFTFENNPSTEGDEFDQIKNGAKYLYYKLPEGVTFAGYKYGQDCYAEDLNGNRTSYYALAKDPATGQEFIVFRILDSYLQNNMQEATVYNCTIKFNTIVDRTNTDDGDRVVALGTGEDGTKYEVKVEFTDLKPTVKKAGKLVDNKDGKPYIEWTITIENPAKDIKIAGFTLSDEMLSKAAAGSIKMSPENVFDSNWVLQDALVPVDKPITVTYNTPVDTATLYNTGVSFVKNKAILSKETASYPSNEVTVNVPAAGSIWKEVKPDYRYADGEIGNNYVWTLSVSSGYGIPLAGFSIADDAFKTAEDVTVLNGETPLVNGTDYTVDATNGKLVFNNTVTATELKISYKNNNSMETNNATLHYPDDTPGSVVTSSCTTYDPYEMTKSGSYNIAGYAEWEIKFIVNDWNVVTLDGLKLTDYEFSNIYDSNGDSVINESDIEVIGYAANNWEITSNIDYKLSGNVITFSTDKSTTGYNQNPACGAIVRFKAKLSAIQEANIKNTLPAVFYNEAVISNDNGFSEKAWKSFTYDPVNKVIKTLGTHTDKVYELGDITKDTKEKLDWNVVVIREHEDGISSSSGTLVDVMQAEGTVDDEAQHYMDTDQREIKVYAKPDPDAVESAGDTYTLLTENTHYTVIYYSDTDGENVAGAGEKVKSFEVEFLSAMDALKYKAAKITYSTTADVSGVKTESEIEFTNKATFNKNQDMPKDTYTVEVYDKEVIPYTKSAIDKNKAEIPADDNTIDLIDVQTETIDGKKYYLFGWKIDFGYYDRNLTLVDTFDEGFTLYGDYIKDSNIVYDSTLNNSYTPKIVYNWGEYNLGIYNGDNQNNYVYHYGTNTVRFARIVCGNVRSITYYTKIPVSEFDLDLLEAGETGITLKNHLVTDDPNYTFDEISSEVHVMGEPDIPLVDMGDVVNKTYIPHDNNPPEDDKGTNNIITFEVDVNHESKDLANGDELVLDDTFYTNYFKDNEWAQPLTGVNLADVILSSIEVRKVISEDVSTLLSASDYSYQYYPGKTGEISVTPTKTMWDPNKKWGFGGLQPGDLLTVTLQHPTPNYVFDKSPINGTDNYMCYDFNHTGEHRINEDAALQFNSDGQYTFELTVPEGITYLDVYSNIAQLSDVNVAVSRTIPVSAANLSLTVPDSTHLKVIYKYALLRNGEALKENNIINFSNEITLTGNGIASSKVENVKYTIKETEASAGIEYQPTIRKLDTADYAVKGLEATFKLGRYNGTKWQWYSQPITSENPMCDAGWSDDVNSSILVTTSDGKFQLNGLEAGKIYVLVETAEPKNIDGYEYEHYSKIKPYYFSYASTPTSFPTGIDDETLSTANVKTIQQNGEIPVTNNRLVNINVTKTWDEPQNNATVKAELYWSYKKVLNGFPDEMTLATPESLGVDSIENPAEFADTYTWSNLPNGKNGKVIYYYVKETAYTIDGTETAVGSGEFSPIYRGNGINSSDSVIKITNASSLSLKKVWLDLNNVPLPDSFIPVDEIEVKLWGKKTQLSTNELVMNGTEETFKITKENGWKLKLTPQQLGNYQFFTVEEIKSSELLNYSESYNYNYEAHTGTITVTNKSDFEIPYTDITVKKLWYDGNGTNRPANLVLTLMQSTDKSNWIAAENQTPDLKQNGNEWIYTYEDLLATDASGNTIYYKVVETVPNGYTLTEINNSGVNSTPEDNPIILANTKTLSIEIEKKWNESNHMLDKVLVDVYRTTDSTKTIEDIADLTPVQQNIEISAITNWKAVTDEFPAYDGLTGDKYYYIVSENPDSLSDAYEPSYLYNGDKSKKSLSLDNGKVLITNSYIYDPVVLPMTGGSGTTIYYVIGMAIILIGCTAYIWTYKKFKSKK